MSADVIQANYEELETIASRFQQQAELNGELFSRLQRNVDILEQGGWEGWGVAAFLAEMQGDIYPAMQRLIHALEEAHRVTLAVKEIIWQAEEEAASIFQGNAEAISTASPTADGEQSWWQRYGEWVHGALDVAGFIPIVGEAADGINALVYLGEGRYVEAGISAAAMIPIVGDLGKAGKWSVKAGKELVEEGAELAARKAPRMVSEAEMVRTIFRADRIPLGKIPAEKIPSHPPGTTVFGDQMHDLVDPVVRRHWPDIQFERTLRGREGPDLIVKSGNPDFDWIEIKPDTQSGVNTFVRTEWGKSQKWSGRGRLAVYDEKGNISLIDYHLYTAD